VSDADLDKLPDGVTVESRSGGGFVLRIEAPDADALMWRLHDVVGMIQTGAFEDRLDALAEPRPSTSTNAKPN
jgi:hypothetical protein